MKTILIVDDEPDIIELVVNRLSSNDFKVIAANDGEEGIKRAKEDSPDLILMDIMMPNMSGGDAVKVLKEDAKTQNIPIIFLTGVYNDRKPEGQEASGINVGGQYYPSLGKPFDGDKLIMAVNKELNN